MNIYSAFRATSHYTQVRNAAARDASLSWAARGLLVWMLSHAEGFNITERSMLAASKRNGRDSLRAILRELSNAGYLIRHQTRDARGRLGANIILVTDDPGAFLEVERMADLVANLAKGNGAGVSDDQSSSNARSPLPNAGLTADGFSVDGSPAAGKSPHIRRPSLQEEQSTEKNTALGALAPHDREQEKASNEPTSHPSPELTLTRAASECLAALDPQAPMEVDPESRARATDQIDVDREHGAHEPPPLRGLLASASDSMLRLEQDHSDEREAQAPAMEDDAMSDADWTPTIKDIARKTAPEQRELRQERGPRDPYTLSEARAALTDSADDAHDDIEQSQDAAPSEASRRGLLAERLEALDQEPQDQRGAIITEQREQAQAAQCVPPRSAPLAAPPAEIIAPQPPTIAAEAPNRDAEAREFDRVMYALENAVLLASVDPSGRDIITMLSPIVKRALKRGALIDDIEVAAIMSIQDAGEVELRDDRKRWRWMISALIAALDGLPAGGSHGQGEASQPTTHNGAQGLCGVRWIDPETGRAMSEDEVAQAMAQVEAAQESASRESDHAGASATAVAGSDPSRASDSDVAQERREPQTYADAMREFQATMREAAGRFKVRAIDPTTNKEVKG